MNLIVSILNGASQVMLQQSPIAGLLILLGIAYNSLIMACAAILGLCTALLSARLCAYASKDTTQGLHGFNAMLISLGLAYLYEMSPFLISLIIFCSIITTALAHYLRQVMNLAVLTLPFILCAWFVTTWLNASNLATKVNHDVSILAESIDSVVLSMGQIYFQENAISGIFFLVALFCAKKLDALVCLASVGLSIALAYILGFNELQVHLGLFGFNAALCSLALMAENPRQKFFWIAATALSSVLLMQVFLSFNIPAFTFPFVLSIWLAQIFRHPFQNNH